MLFKIKTPKKVYNIEIIQSIYVLILSYFLKDILNNETLNSTVKTCTNALLYIFCAVSIFYLMYKSSLSFCAGKKSISFIFLLVGIPILIVLLLKTIQCNQETKNTIFILLLRISACCCIFARLKKLMLNSEKLSARNNKIVRYLKLQIVNLLLKLYKYEFSKNLLSIIGINYLDLRNSNIPKERDFFFNFRGFNVYEVKLPYLDTNFYYFNGVYFEDSIFTKPDNEDELQDFVEFMYKSTGYQYINHLPAGDYSKISFKGVDLSRTSFDKNCILSKDINFFQRVSRQDLSEAELPIECLNNIHLYDLNKVRLNLSLHEWYKEVLTPSQIILIEKKYPSQINKNIILPN